MLKIDFEMISAEVNIFKTCFVVSFELHNDVLQENFKSAKFGRLCETSKRYGLLSDFVAKQLE
jgi:hypothetical protein